jgi:hypothetical protein
VVLIRKAIGLKRRKLHPRNVSHLKFATVTRGFQRRQRARRVRAVSVVHSEAVEQKQAITPPLPKAAE